MMAKLQVGAGGYDIVVPTGYIVTVLAAQNLLYPLHKDLLTNWSNVAPMFVNPSYDPDNKYGVPRQWARPGSPTARTRSTRRPTPGRVPGQKLKGKMTMMDDERDVIGAWLLFRGKSLNSVDPADLQQAKADAVRCEGKPEGLRVAPVKAQLIAGGRVGRPAVGRRHDAGARRGSEDRVRAAQGRGRHLDGLARDPRVGTPQTAAHEFMNFILRPDVGAGISMFTGYGTPKREGDAARGRGAAVPERGRDETARVPEGSRHGEPAVGSAVD
jgi:spermidine/putrescine transport system substrate-binding protein